jgi:hypothetical protein
MPYKIVKKGTEFCVVKEDGGKSFGCHASREKATAQLRALYAQEETRIAEEKEFSAARREKLASQKKALPGGSFPIENAQDLRNAIKAIGRAKNPAAAKAHIIRRAKALGLTKLLPDDWKVSAKEAIDHKQRLATELYIAEEITNFDDQKMEAEVTIVKPGISENRINHKPAAIAKAVEEGIWDGSRMFIDHGEPGNMERMPWRRSIRDLVSRMQETWVGSIGEAKGRVKFLNKEFYEFAKEAKDAIGLSMATWYEGRPARENGQRVYEVERYTKNRSIDWVAFPAAGGAIDKFLPAQEGMEVDWDELTADMLLEHRPDLIPTAATESAGNEPGDGNKTKPAEGSAPVATITEVDVQRMLGAALEEAKSEWKSEFEQEQTEKDTARAQVADFVKDAGLPEPSEKAIIRQFSGVKAFVEEDVQTAIDEKFTELEAAGFRKGPRVSNGGRSETPEVRDEPLSDDDKAKAGFGDLVSLESQLTYEPASQEGAAN